MYNWPGMNKVIKLKVCGMKDSDNIAAVSKLGPDYLGFIFYEKSPRFAGNGLDKQMLQQLSPAIKKVGVFVNAAQDSILKTVAKYNLNAIQLHGDETPDQCEVIRNKGLEVIKAFAFDDYFNFGKLEHYKKAVDYFLFDTKGKDYGGNGYAFNWQILKKYDNEKPFFLSGGVGLDNVENIKDLSKFNIHAIDVNSKFELKPGVKDIPTLVKLVEKLRKINN